MQSYLKYNEYYDRKAKVAPLNEKDFFILQPKADNQASKIPFRDYRWIGPYQIEKVLPNDKYIFRRSNADKTQILHRSRLKKFVLNTHLENKYFKKKLQPDDEIIIPQDDLYTISWEADFDYQGFEPRQDDSSNEAAQAPQRQQCEQRNWWLRTLWQCGWQPGKTKTGHQPRRHNLTKCKWRHLWKWPKQYEWTRSKAAYGY